MTVYHEEGSFKNGKKDGEWLEVFGGGGVRHKSMGFYKNGERVGLWIELTYHFPFGHFRDRSEGFYKKNKKDGSWIFYNHPKEGIPQKEEIYKDGEFIETKEY